MHLPLSKLSKRYFFESDILFRLNTIRAVVTDIPMVAVYDNQVSNLKIREICGEFALKHLGNTGKRLFYNGKLCVPRVLKLWKSEIWKL